MRIKIILACFLSVVTLSSCSLVGPKKPPINDGIINSDFGNQLLIMEKEKGESSYKAYVKANEYLDSLYNSIDNYQKNVTDYSLFNNESKNLNLSYWNNHDKLMITLKKTLSDDKNYQYYSQKIDADYYRNLDTNKLFHTRTYETFDGDEFNNLINSTKEKVEKEEIEYETLKSIYIGIDQKMDDLENWYSLSSLYQDLYASDLKYSNDFSLANGCYTKCNNSYKDLTKSILNSKFKSQFANDFKLSSQDINSILDKVIYPQEIIDLFEQEEELMNSFSAAFNSNSNKFNYKRTFLNLVKVRRNIASELGYDNYLSYVWNNKFGRDYTIEQSQNLINQITNKNKFSDLYSKAKNNVSDNAKTLTKVRISETDIFNALEFTSNITSKASDAIRELRTYGNYNFELRSDKYSGSYVYNYDNYGNYYILVDVDGSVLSIPSTVHEFGHYLGVTKSDPSLNGSSFSLDICEVHSQGLEYLMSNYFSELYGDKIAKNLIQYQLYDILWTLLSGCVISEFENYVYTTDIENLSVSEFDSHFSFLCSSLPTTYFSYSNIPHIFLHPGYYISYVTSIVPSLELWSMDINKAKEAYNTIISYGQYNGFNFVLEKAGMESPFEEETIKHIFSKIESYLV